MLPPNPHPPSNRLPRPNQHRQPPYHQRHEHSTPNLKRLIRHHPDQLDLLAVVVPVPVPGTVPRGNGPGVLVGRRRGILSTVIDDPMQPERQAAGPGSLMLVV